jgi:hypothetical protein
MQAICTNKDFFVIQAKILKKAIEENKWFLSEKEHRDVGWAVAEENFLQVYSSGFNAGYRACYCGLCCPIRNECTQAIKWIESNEKDL